MHDERTVRANPAWPGTRVHALMALTGSGSSEGWSVVDANRQVR